MEGAGCVGCAVEVLGAGVAWGGGLVGGLVDGSKGRNAAVFVLDIFCGGSGILERGELSEKYLQRYIAFGSMTEQLSGWGL